MTNTSTDCDSDSRENNNDNEEIMKVSNRQLNYLQLFQKYGWPHIFLTVTCDSKWCQIRK